MNNNPVLHIKNVSYTYDGTTLALDDVNLSIYQNEKIAVLGANGAGKSTLFLCINGVIVPNKGEIFLDHTLINHKNINDLRKNVGIVFQDAESQIIASTVFSEVSFGPMNLKLPKEEVKRRTLQALEAMNLTNFSDKPPHYLSGGEKKRVTIADIIAMESRIIIFDEPNAALDPYNQQMLEQILEKLSTEGKSLVISTHDVDFAYRFADRVIIFFEGRIIADGSPTDIFKNESVLKKANLKRPYMFEIVELLFKKGILEEDDNYPKNINELEGLL